MKIRHLHLEVNQLFIIKKYTDIQNKLLLDRCQTELDRVCYNNILHMFLWDM